MSKCYNCSSENHLQHCPKCGQQFCGSCMGGLYCRDCKRRKDDEESHDMTNPSNWLDPSNLLNPLNPLSPISPMNPMNLGD